MTALEKIHSLDAFGSRPGLDRIKRFLSILGNPQDSLRFIHVAGTNGKGSTCQLISSVLTQAGLKTGLFISPYILDFRERIQINGVMISEKTLEDAVERTFPILLRLREDGCVITEFEYVMALEFMIHAEAKCDVVVLETGMGGLLDCTNVIKPPLCTVITSIGLDHTAVLGDTIEEIAAQKCGIIKAGSVAVTSPQKPQAMRVIEQTCAGLGVELIKSEQLDVEVKSESLRRTVLGYRGTELILPLIGAHQVENAKTALAALETVRDELGITDRDIAAGFEHAVNPARLELISEDPVILLDGAHNPDGINSLKNALDKFNSGKRAVCVLGMLADKDSKSSVELLGGMFDEVYTVTVGNPRTLTADELAERCKPYFGCVEACGTVKDALEKARKAALEKHCIMVIAGSLYLAAEARRLLLQ